MPKAKGTGLRATVPPEYQAPATLNQANPVQNTWYTVLDTTLNCRIWAILIQIDTTGETLDVQITVDGQVIPSSGAVCVAGNAYEICFGYSGALGVLPIDNLVPFDVGSPFSRYRAYLIEGRSVKVEVRKTTAAGAGNLRAEVQYSTW